VDKLELSCEVSYLYGSRLAWNIAALETLDEEWIWAQEIDHWSIQAILDRLDINIPEVCH
jgi:hypothetical protein